MRYIDTSRIPVPTNWVELAKKSGCSNVWSYFKTDLEKIVGKKCWYNETVNIDPGNPIDHFRPKSHQVRELKKENANLEMDVWNQLNAASRSGYSFLEFEFSNYRYASRCANSPHKKESRNGLTRGKWDFFPLKKTSICATCISDVLNCIEEPALLDPCNPGDPEMLTFTKLGLIEASKFILNNSWEYCRVKVSIEVYHLEYPVLVEKRSLTWNTYSNHIEILNMIYKKIINEGKNTLTKIEKKSLKHHIQCLRNGIDKKSQFSAVVIDCIRFFKKKKGYGWLSLHFSDQILTK